MPAYKALPSILQLVPQEKARKRLVSLQVLHELQINNTTLISYLQTDIFLHFLGPRNPRPKQETEPVIRPSTTQTAPKDEPLYTGNNRGSKPVKKTLAQNMECAGFIPLVRQVYDRIAVEDQRIPRNLPFPIFQHAMCEFLVAFQLHQAKYVLKVPGLQTMMDPLSAISAEEYNIPIPIFEYICGFSPTITPAGDKV
uniref:Uncharacterized protein n=1 Tax=Glossina palpalis gambiensis TaxID=67801 RepID=A0A1B0BYT0_9MUSC